MKEKKILGIFYAKKRGIINNCITENPLKNLLINKNCKDKSLISAINSKKNNRIRTNKKMEE